MVFNFLTMSELYAINLVQEVDRVIRIRRVLRDFLNKPEEGHVKPLVNFDSVVSEKSGDHLCAVESVRSELK